jgi:hypothetical protein
MHSTGFRHSFLHKACIHSHTLKHTTYKIKSRLNNRIAMRSLPVSLVPVPPSAIPPAPLLCSIPSPRIFVMEGLSCGAGWHTNTIGRNTTGLLAPPRDRRPHLTHTQIRMYAYMHIRRSSYDLLGHSGCASAHSSVGHCPTRKNNPKTD